MFLFSFGKYLICKTPTDLFTQKLYRLGTTMIGEQCLVKEWRVPIGWFFNVSPCFIMNMKINLNRTCLRRRISSKTHVKTAGRGTKYGKYCWSRRGGVSYFQQVLA